MLLNRPNFFLEFIFTIFNEVMTKNLVAYFFGPAVTATDAVKLVEDVILAENHNGKRLRRYDTHPDDGDV